MVLSTQQQDKLRQLTHDLLSEILDQIQITNINLNKTNDMLVVTFIQDGEQQTMEISEIMEDYYQEDESEIEEMEQIYNLYLKLIKAVLECNFSTNICSSKEQQYKTLQKVYNGKIQSNVNLNDDNATFFICFSIKNKSEAPKIFYLNKQLQFREMKYTNTYQLQELFNKYKISDSETKKPYPDQKEEKFEDEPNIGNSGSYIKQLQELQKYIQEQLQKLQTSKQSQQMQNQQQLNTIQKFKTMVQVQFNFTQMQINQIGENTEINKKKKSYLLIDSLDKFVQKIIEKDEFGLLNHLEVLKDTEKIIFN